MSKSKSTKSAETIDIKNHLSNGYNLRRINECAAKRSH
jgi:hypothetical protein